MNFDEALSNPTTRPIVLDKIENLMAKLNRIAARMNGERVPPITKSTTDAVAATDRLKAAAYAFDVNTIGARMARRPCREPLPVAEAVSWPVQVTDAAGPQDCVDFYEQSRRYAEQCRKLHRK